MSVKSSFGLMGWVALIGGGVAACSGAEVPSGDPAGSNQDELRVVKVPKPPFCGGIAGIPCPEGQACIDDPSDDCDPKHGGADCGGICVDAGTPCGRAACGPGTVCCNPLVGMCAKPGMACTQ